MADSLYGGSLAITRENAVGKFTMIAGALVFTLVPLLALLHGVRTAGRDWRESVVLASLLWGAGLLALTEVLGAFSALTLWPVLAAWLLAHVWVAGLLWVAWRGRVHCSSLWPGDGLGRVFVLVCALLLGLTGLAAVFAPPNTPDVLSYHLPRQLHWLQQGRMAHFITSDDRALMMPPFAEIIQAHAFLLAQGDGWANVPQWLTYALGMIVVSLLARELGAKVQAQLLAAVVFGTLPMAYHEASSAKNDLMVAVWLGIFAWVVLRLLRDTSRELRLWLAGGAALGLALATKSTAFVFGFPVGLVALFAVRRNYRGAVLFAVVALLLTGPHLVRNQLWYGTPMGIHRAEDGGAQASEIWSWRSLLSGVLRNSTLHVSTPSPNANGLIATSVARVHGWMGQDIDDPRTTLWKLRYNVVWGPRAEMVAGAPVHFLLGLATIGWLLVRRLRGAEMTMGLMIVAGGVLYCLLLKWQPWGARLHLPVFMLLAAMSAVVAERMGPRAVWVVAAACFAGWIPSAQTQIRPLWTAPTIFTTSRWENYFRVQSQERAFAEAALQAIRQASVESLQIVSRHGFPYPILSRYLAENGPRAKLWGELPAAATIPPDGVLLMEPFARPLPLYLFPAGAKERYRAVGATDPYALYVPEARARALASRMPLPQFVGWEESSGFSVPEIVNREGRAVPVYRMAGSVLQFKFRRSAERMSVRIEVANTGAAACELRVLLEGRRVATLRFEPGQETQVVQIPLTPIAERSELSLVALPEGASSVPLPLMFFAVQIED
jgi:hypothetical protein